MEQKKSVWNCWVKHIYGNHNIMMYLLKIIDLFCNIEEISGAEMERENLNSIHTTPSKSNRLLSFWSAKTGTEASNYSDP